MHGLQVHAWKERSEDSGLVLKRGEKGRQHTEEFHVYTCHIVFLRNVKEKKKEIYNEELYSFYLPDIITTIKSRNMRWACYEAHMVNTRNT